MDLNSIITSGDLEIYVLGMMPADQSKKIAFLADLFPEVREEIDMIIATLLAMSDTADLTPSRSVKNTLLRKLSALGR